MKLSFPSVDKSSDKFQGKEPRYYDLITGLVVAILLISEVVASKLVRLGPFQVVGGTILFPVSYIFGDILTEVYGYTRARRVVWIGFIAVILQALFFMIVQIMPSAASWHNQDAYNAIIGFVPRISLASVVAYWTGSFANDFVMAKMKIWTAGKYLWTRTVGSTIVGEGVDSVIFITLAFWGIFPNSVIVSIILSIYLLKTLYEIVATPLTYWVVRFLKRAEGLDVYDYHTNFSPFHF